VPVDTLRMVEEASLDDPVQLQNGFNTFDECSAKSELCS